MLHWDDSTTDKIKHIIQKWAQIPVFKIWTSCKFTDSVIDFHRFSLSFIAITVTEYLPAKLYVREGRSLVFFLQYMTNL